LLEAASFDDIHPTIDTSTEDNGNIVDLVGDDVKPEPDDSFDVEWVDKDDDDDGDNLD
jgi:hypothetical protein